MRSLCTGIVAALVLVRKPLRDRPIILRIYRVLVEAIRAKTPHVPPRVFHPIVPRPCRCPRVGTHNLAGLRAGRRSVVFFF